MATTADIKITEGSGKNLASYSITEDSETKIIQRIVPSDAYGNPLALPSIPKIIQQASNVSSGSVASLAKAFTSNNVGGNTVIVVCAVGNGTTPTVSDTAGNTYTQAAQVANGTAFNTAIFFAVNILAGANTITVTNGGSTASIAMEIYEASGLLAVASAQPGVNASASGTSGTAATAAIVPGTPNRLVFAGIALGTAAQTITPATGWTNDSGQQNPTTPAGLFSFASMSQYLGTIGTITPQATFTSEPWAIVAATFRGVSMNIEGAMEISDGTNIGNILKSDGTAAGQNAQLVAGTYLEKASLTAAALNADLVPSTDVSNYKLIALQISGTWSGTLQLQGSNDNTNFIAIGGSDANGWGYVGNISSNSLYIIPVIFRYFRVRMTSYTSGTANGTLEIYTQTATPFTSVARTVEATSSAVDGTSNSQSAPQSNTGNMIYNRTYSFSFNGATWDRLRTPNTFKTATATASGNTALWTPASGKKFRLMGFQVIVPGNAAISGGGVVVDVTFQDNTTAMGVAASLFIPTTSGTTQGNDFNSGFVPLGNGILSAAANNVLNMNLSSALTTGKVRVVAIGTEE